MKTAFCRRLAALEKHQAATGGARPETWAAVEAWMRGEAPCPRGDDAARAFGQIMRAVDGKTRGLPSQRLAVPA